LILTTLGKGDGPESLGTAFNPFNDVMLVADIKDGDVEEEM
jgi:hypothetical protein